MSDVNDTVPVADATAVEPVTTTPPSQEGNETTEPTVPVVPEKTVPYSRFSEVNKEYREAQRKLAEFESKSKLIQYDPNDMEAVMAHPYVQELLIKQAKSELTSFARDLLGEHPEIPEAVRKAVLSNVRGFVKESTTNINSAKIDIQEWIEQLAEGGSNQPIPKVIPVASTTTPISASGAIPMDVQTILETPVDEWTEDQAKIVDKYKQSQPKNRG